ncbi:DUF2690 domain-containing protein [Kitasatospora sp. NPDC047058]|uniref:helix-turn-helix domain-containing protein n=1 Tax=Kitasatospora sp. NPDC047058 TaxID=3155620 RepID=UPI003405627B
MASAWKHLPDELSAPARRLTEELRAVKDATGLSLSELATRTHYSRASWERWLNGKRVVTEQALEALIKAVDCDGPALRALWASAAEAGDAAETAVTAGAAGAAGAAAENSAAHDAGPGVTGAGVPAGSEAASDAGSDAGSDGGSDGGSAVETADEGGPGADEEPVPAPAAATPRWWRRPAALVAGALVAAVLLVLAGFRFTHGTGENSATVAESVPPTSPSVPAKPVSPAPPAAACQAMGCSHKDPKSTGCGADARTLQTGNIGKVVIYLRYSQKCQAAWAAITEGAPDDWVSVTSSTGEKETGTIHWGYDNYSAMVNAADPAATFQVCGWQPEGSDCTVSVSGLAQMVASTPIPIGPASPPPVTASPSAAAAQSK